MNQAFKQCVSRMVFTRRSFSFRCRLQSLCFFVMWWGKTSVVGLKCRVHSRVVSVKLVMASNWAFFFCFSFFFAFSLAFFHRIPFHTTHSTTTRHQQNHDAVSRFILITFHCPSDEMEHTADGGRVHPHFTVHRFDCQVAAAHGSLCPAHERGSYAPEGRLQGSGHDPHLRHWSPGWTRARLVPGPGSWRDQPSVSLFLHIEFPL